MAATLFTALIIIGATSFVIMFFILLNRRHHNRRIAKQKIVLNELIWKHKLEIIEKENINDCVLAIDMINFVLLYVNFRRPEEVITIIDLWKVKSASVITEESSIYEQKKENAVLVDKQVSKLQLEVSLSDANASKSFLMLFAYEDGMHDFLEIKRRAEHWKDIINNCVKELQYNFKQVAGRG
jgi:hypothetical protein